MIRRDAARLAAPALLILLLLLIVTGSWDKSATFDEAVHIHSGWRILTAGDFATNHEHPPLMKALAALPLVLGGARPPASEMKREIDQWTVAHDFVYHANDGDWILRTARLPIALVAVALAWALHWHAASTLGAPAGLVALALLVFEPNVLAHAGLVTTDLGNTALTFLTFVSFLAALKSGTRRAMLLCGVSFGLALLAKFTAVLLAPILVLTGAAVTALEGGGRDRLRRLGAALAVVLGCGLLVLNIGYGFGGTFSTLRSFTPESEAFRRHAAGALGALPLPLPVEYVRGFDHAEAGGQSWWAYLFGRHSRSGWPHYYLAALAVKTPLPLLLMAGAGLLAWPWARGRGKDALRAVHVLAPAVPLAVYLAAFTLSSNLKNIGLRYILPVYPFLCLAAAAATRLRPGRPWLAWGLVAWQAAAVLWVHPDLLTFFNLTVGGPSRGREVLLDSNLDWGQDLKGLGRFIRDNRIDSIYVDYFGRACFRHEKVRSTPDFQGGWIAVSATHLKGVYAEDKDRYRFLWDQTPRAVIGGSIFVYEAARPPGWVPKAAPLESR